MLICLFLSFFSIVFYSISFLLGYLYQYNKYKELLQTLGLFGIFLFMDIFILFSYNTLLPFRQETQDVFLFIYIHIQKTIAFLLYISTLKTYNYQLKKAISQKALIILPLILGLLIVNQTIFETLNFFSPDLISSVLQLIILRATNAVKILLALISIALLTAHSHKIEDSEDQKDFIFHVVLVYFFFIILTLFRENSLIFQNIRQLKNRDHFDIYLVYGIPLFYYFLGFGYRAFYLAFRFPQVALRYMEKRSESIRDRFRLTPRETEILISLVLRKKTGEIAQSFEVSERTVENHIYSLFKKVGVSTRIELINTIMTEDHEKNPALPVNT